MVTPRVLITKEAEKVMDELREKYGELMFHQSGGCCDGSQPMCFEKGDFKIGSSDVCLGTIAGCEFWMSKDQFEYWKHTQLEVDVTNGRGSSFSLEIPMGKRFFVKSHLFSEGEAANLSPLTYLED
ncbi:hypothetical protein Oweho_1613 [Owenweeksia hongkongensis DSM 17368]|uniref:UDP-glucose 4-epimerase n=1 Tax=Owenweeksia hongkongensis (strain DSM 17368 / CIP 108786 / JCM 12287 / NRRL B-23963 / UST20020801) TaxID=926562 RepID=G8QZH4_OWEHD|nr:DUF779 domain-containing protein [Owenweeksia hongkongensis]AEV32602.1 hypothetical protein Oweho_1613 [Owenweeksia hongkongensis DSM 17368]